MRRECKTVNLKINIVNKHQGNNSIITHLKTDAISTEPLSEYQVGRTFL